MIRLPSRFLEFTAAVAGLTLAAVTPAQGFPVLDVVQDANSTEVTFDLEYPTPPPSGDVYAMLVCYISVPDDAGPWSDLIRAATGAVYIHAGDNGSNAWAAAIAGVDADAPLDGDPYTIPPSVVSAAVAEIDWENEYLSFARPFSATMSWPTGGWAPSSNTMNWGGLVAGTSFDIRELMRTCLLRQVGWVMDKPVTDQEVVSQVDAVMGMKDLAKAGFELNTVIVQLADGPGDRPTTPTLRLSRTKKITIQLPGKGGGPEAYFHWNRIYPVYDESMLLVEFWSPLPPPDGDYVFFLPTSSGMVSVPATVVQGLYSYGFRCDAPVGIETGEFAIFNLTTLQYAPMAGLLEPTLTNWVYRTLHAPQAP